ncbi:menin-like [Antedon mediterranea]|uniref:menin-like n=1 Tax=Antedon mediterranea TaxID=105859 RepID=UPI003AF96A61
MQRAKPKMAGFRDAAKRLFPLQDIQSVVELFRLELTTDGHEPNLAMLSLVAGIVENGLTSNRANTVMEGMNESRTLEPIFPVVQMSYVEAFLAKFESQIKGSVDLSEHKSNFATREMVKKISDVVWSSLCRGHYKDKAHLQSLYSYLTGNRLDCFGVAFAVVAACQVLGFDDVHLALSEDHAWVIFGENGKETAEVTWHGKGNEDKRGQPITAGVADQSWLYLNGYPVICTREMEVSALVSAINPSISSTQDSIELAELQQELLWLLYDLKHLEKYPMALGNLGDLESIAPSQGRPCCEDIFESAINSAQRYYNDHHVYPYTYLGGHLYRHQRYKDALKRWAQASSVVSKYNYYREDEEIYKEFLDIAFELIPNIVKEFSHSVTQNSPLCDPECYAYFLQFYDGLCRWEEGSVTPVLHITWSKKFIGVVSKFASGVRELIDVHVEEDDDCEDEEKIEEDNDHQKENVVRPKMSREKKEEKATNEYHTKNKISLRSKNYNVTRKKLREDINQNIITDKSNNNNNVKPDSLDSSSDSIGNELKTPGQQLDVSNPNIAALAAACSESILNPDYLLGASETSTPFASKSWDTKTDLNDFLSGSNNGGAFPGITIESALKAESPAEMAFHRQWKARQSDSQGEDSEEEEGKPSHTSVSAVSASQMMSPKLTLSSAKMKGLKDLLTNPGKLNTAAIQLQLTAQSQVQFNKRPRSTSEYEDFGSLRRRPRRE